jgi:hypothetical protein
MYQLAMRIMQIAVVVGFVYFTQDINPAPGTKEGLLVGMSWGVFAAAHRRCHPVAVRTPQAARPFCAS